MFLRASSSCIRISYVVSFPVQWSIPNVTLLPLPIYQHSLSMIKFAEVTSSFQKFEPLLYDLDGFLSQSLNDEGEMYSNTSFHIPYLAMRFHVLLAMKSFAKIQTCFIPEPPSSFVLERVSHETNGGPSSSLFLFHRYLKIICLVWDMMCLGRFFNPIP